MKSMKEGEEKTWFNKHCFFTRCPNRTHRCVSEVRELFVHPFSPSKLFRSFSSWINWLFMWMGCMVAQQEVFLNIQGFQISKEKTISPWVSSRCSGFFPPCRNVPVARQAAVNFSYMWIRACLDLCDGLFFLFHPPAQRSWDRLLKQQRPGYIFCIQIIDIFAI